MRGFEIIYGRFWDIGVPVIKIQETPVIKQIYLSMHMSILTNEFKLEIITDKFKRSLLNITNNQMFFSQIATSTFKYGATNIKFRMTA